jgi:hypothetical protein
VIELGDENAEHGTVRNDGFDLLFLPAVVIRG